jgi:hypothetical protein
VFHFHELQQENSTLISLRNTPAAAWCSMVNFVHNNVAVVENQQLLLSSLLECNKEDYFHSIA